MLQELILASCSDLLSCWTVEASRPALASPLGKACWSCSHGYPISVFVQALKVCGEEVDVLVPGWDTIALAPGLSLSAAFLGCLVPFPRWAQHLTTVNPVGHDQLLDPGTTSHCDGVLDPL